MCNVSLISREVLTKNSIFFEEYFDFLNYIIFHLHFQNSKSTPVDNSTSLIITTWMIHQYKFIYSMEENSPDHTKFEVHGAIKLLPLL